MDVFMFYLVTPHDIFRVIKLVLKNDTRAPLLQTLCVIKPLA